MKDEKEKDDWSTGSRRKALTDQRKFMWSPEAVEKYASWMNLRQGMTAVDVGCGLGFLGMTYWPYIGQGGCYIGIDISLDLLKSAAEGAEEWAEGGRAFFIKGSAFDLPFADDSIDWIMCQTLLMHLEEPEKAVKEMIRVLKPGGLFMCKEPDNLSSGLVKGYFSARQFSLEEYLLKAKVLSILHEGRKKLGQGDHSIGNKMPHILAMMGMTEIDIRLNERVFFIEPPYESEEQKHRLNIMKRELFEEKDWDFWIEKAKKEYAAGGGDIEEYNRWLEVLDQYKAAAKEQMEQGTFGVCSGSFFYIIKARKP